MSNRKITIDNQIWQFKIGRSNTKIISPQNKSTIVNHSKLTGRSWDTIERGLNKKTLDGMIEPIISKIIFERIWFKLNLLSIKDRVL